MRELLERLLAGTASGRQPLTHVENLPARAASTAAWPDWVPEVLLSRAVQLLDLVLSHLSRV